MNNEAVEYMKQVLRDSKETLPTLSLQLESLNRFMKSVGYIPTDSHGQNFKLVNLEKPYPRHLNWKAAVTLHNYGIFVKRYPYYEVGIPYRPYSTSSVDLLWDSWNSKLVESVYLLWSKKSKQWIVHEDRVKFVNPEEPCPKDDLT